MARWAVLLALTGALAAACGRAGLPSPTLFAGLVAGAAVALGTGGGLALPRRGVRAAEAVVGVTLGAFLELDTLRAVAADVVPIALVSAATLALSIGAGLLLARLTGLDAPTASLGMITGGATGIIVLARDLGADQRLVAVMQYLRVLVIVALSPVAAAVLFGAGSEGGGLSAGAGTGPAAWAGPLAFTAACAAAGLALAVRLPVPAGTLLLPLALAAVATAGGLAPARGVPEAVGLVVFAVIGLDVGVRFTRASLREAGRILLPSLAVVAGLLVACGALGLLLVPLAGVSALDGYLATTPGGLFAVLGVAVGSGADTTFVLAVQVLRLFAMLLAAPALARRLAPGRRAATTPPERPEAPP